MIDVSRLPAQYRWLSKVLKHAGAQYLSGLKEPYSIMLQSCYDQFVVQYLMVRANRSCRDDRTTSVARYVFLKQADQLSWHAINDADIDTCQDGNLIWILE